MVGSHPSLLMYWTVGFDGRPGLLCIYSQFQPIPHSHPLSLSTQPTLVLSLKFKLQNPAATYTSSLVSRTGEVAQVA